MPVDQLVPINDLKRLYEANADRISRAASSVLASGWWLNGQEAAAFCQEFAAATGTDHCIGVANGSDAIEIAMRALIEVRGLRGREAVTVANAGGYSTLACRLIGLVPVYADVEEVSQLASINSIISALSAETALVVVTHLYGGVLDVPALREKMDADGYSAVPILEDCAQAHGAPLNGRVVGSLGDVAAFSFYPTKNLGAFGDAGAILTNDAALAEAAKRLHQYGWSQKFTVAMPGGRNSRMDEIQAAILRALLPGLDEANRRRQEVLERYEAVAFDAALQVVRSPHGTVAHLAVVLCDDRDRLRQHLLTHGVASEIHYPVLDCDQTGWAMLPQRIAPDGLAVTRKSAGRLLTLPCFPTMTPGEVDRVCEALATWRA